MCRDDGEQNATELLAPLLFQKLVPAKVMSREMPRKASRP